MSSGLRWFLSFFFFNDTATTEIYTLSLHDALPIFPLPFELPKPTEVPLATNSTLLMLPSGSEAAAVRFICAGAARTRPLVGEDRKSTRLNSSHSQISYAVFCLKKKNRQPITTHITL